MCDGNNNIEHLYKLPSRWLFLLQFEEFSNAINEKNQNDSCTPISILLRKI